MFNFEGFIRLWEIWKLIVCWEPHLSPMVLLYIIILHIFALLFFIYDVENIFNIKLHCLHVSQAIAPCMMFIKLLFIKYALLVIRLKIIRALV